MSSSSTMSASSYLFCRESLKIYQPFVDAAKRVAQSFKTEKPKEGEPETHLSEKRSIAPSIIQKAKHNNTKRTKINTTTDIVTSSLSKATKTTLSEEPPFRSMKYILDRSILSELRTRFSCDDVKLICKLGVGTYGTVYLISFGKPQPGITLSALKVIKTETDFSVSPLLSYGKKPESINELIVQQLITHPNIISYRYVGSSINQISIVMESFPRNLSTAYRDDFIPRDIPTLKLLLSQLLEALIYMHANGIVHRDLQPANILVKRDVSGKPIFVIADFSICIFEGTTDLAGYQHTLIMAPENRKENDHGEELNRYSRYLPSCDVYSLGVLGIYFLTGFFFKSTMLRSLNKLIIHPGARDFLIKCIQPLNTRPNAFELLSHPFLLLPGVVSPSPWRRFAQLVSDFGPQSAQLFSDNKTTFEQLAPIKIITFTLLKVYKIDQRFEHKRTEFISLVFELYRSSLSEWDIHHPSKGYYLPLALASLMICQKLLADPDNGISKDGYELQLNGALSSKFYQEFMEPYRFILPDIAEAESFLCQRMEKKPWHLHSTFLLRQITNLLRSSNINWSTNLKERLDKQTDFTYKILDYELSTPTYIPNCSSFRRACLLLESYLTLYLSELTTDDMHVFSMIKHLNAQASQ